MKTDGCTSVRGSSSDSTAMTSRADLVAPPPPAGAAARRRAAAAGASRAPRERRASFAGNVSPKSYGAQAAGRAWDAVHAVAASDLGLELGGDPCGNQPPGELDRPQVFVSGNRFRSFLYETKAEGVPSTPVEESFDAI